jgi:cell division septation protein DedD
MAGGSRGGGDMVLGGRHLVGIFALLVVVLGIVFTLGYLLGRSQFEGQPSAAVVSNDSEKSSSSAKSASPEPSTASAPTESAGRSDAPPATWDFYHSNEPAKTPERLELAPKPAATAPPKPVATPPKPPEPATAPPETPAPNISPGSSALIPKGAITLQVAALIRQADALALAQALQEKKFPAIVTTPSTDKYYRVQVGPYPDAKSATAARRDLEKQGFKSIVRR